MPGTARTDSFLLSTATVMVGSQSDLYNLNSSHSLGLVKNVVMQSEPSFVELTQGITNDLVFSVKNQDNVRISMEVYEFTSKNIGYAAGLLGAENLQTISTVYTLSQSAAPAASSIVVSGDATADITAGDWIVLDTDGEENVHIVKVTSASFSVSETTIDITGYEIPTGFTWPAGARVRKVNALTLGGSNTQPFYSVKIAGLMPKDNKPIVLLLPKVRITRGLNISFQTDNFVNMPFEITPYSLAASDPFYSDFGSAKARVLTGN